MSKLVANTITRHGSEFTKTFFLVIDGDRQLSTPIHKLEMQEQIRNFGAKKVPIEQYAFRVGKNVVARFADAAALVIKRHNVALDPEAEDVQIYVRRAFDIVSGKTELRTVPADQVKDMRFKPGEETETDEQNAAVQAELEAHGEEAPATEPVAS